jgi:hypothetical protein
MWQHHRYPRRGWHQPPATIGGASPADAPRHCRAARPVVLPRRRDGHRDIHLCRDSVAGALRARESGVHPRRVRVPGSAPPLPPPRRESHAGLAPRCERRRLHFAVWALSAALSCAFAYRVSLLMPAALVVLVWCMTSFVVLFGFYMLVHCNKDHQQYQSVDDIDCDAAGDGNKPLMKKIGLSEGMV